MTLIAGALAFVVVVLIVYLWIGHSGSGQIPVVMSDPNPIRVAPVNPGGLRPDEVGERMFRDARPGEVHLEPPPEAPQPKPR